MSDPTRYINLGKGARQIRVRMKPRAPQPQPNGPVPTVYDDDAEPSTRIPPVNFNLATSAPDHDYQVDLNAIQDTVSKPPPTPANEGVMKAARQFTEDFPKALGPSITSVRDFFLAEVLPVVSSIENGMGEAIDVVRVSLEEEPDTAAYARLLTGLSMIAVRIKTVSFLSRHYKMTEEEHALFRMFDMISNSPQGTNDVHDLKTLMQQMLEVSRLQRPGKGNARTRVRPVQAAEGRKPRPGGDVLPRGRTEERKPRVSDSPERPGRPPRGTRG